MLPAKGSHRFFVATDGDHWDPRLSGPATTTKTTTSRRRL